MANNPYANKILLADGTTLIDLTSDTVVADKMLSGVTAHNRAGAVITGSIQSQAGATITPSRTEQTAVAAQRYTTGAVKVAPIPANYYTLEDIYTIGSLWATYDGTATPGNVLGFGTWIKVSPIQPTWNRLKETSTWANMNIDEPMIFVWRRTE